MLPWHEHSVAKQSRDNQLGNVPQLELYVKPESGMAVKILPAAPTFRPIRFLSVSDNGILAPCATSAWGFLLLAFAP